MQCMSRRCLANDFITEDLYSAPQPADCFLNVNLTSIQYETLSFVSTVFPFNLYSFSSLSLILDGPTVVMTALFLSLQGFTKVALL